MRIIVNLALMLVLWLGATGARAEFDRIRVAEGVSFTHAHVQRTGGELADDANSKTGKRWVDTKLRSIEEAQRIPLVKGHGFNVQLLLLLLPTDTRFLDFSMIHPAMILPSGEVLTTQSGRIPTDAELLVPTVSFTYTLDEDYELVEGDWALAFSHRGEELFNITFTTYRPTATVPTEYPNTGIR